MGNELGWESAPTCRGGHWFEPGILHGSFKIAYGSIN